MRRLEFFKRLQEGYEVVRFDKVREDERKVNQECEKSTKKIEDGQNS